MGLELHRMGRELGGIAYLLTIDASTITGNPAHILRFINNWGEKGLGVRYQGNTFKPHPYKLDSVSRSTKSSKQGATLNVSDTDYEFTRFLDYIGGSLEGARVYEYKVYERFLDNGVEANINAYSKRLDHIVSHVSTSSNGNEVIIATVDPLSREVDVPRIQFSAGIPNSSVYDISVFPAVNRSLAKR